MTTNQNNVDPNSAVSTETPAVSAVAYPKGPGISYIILDNSGIKIEKHTNILDDRYMYTGNSNWHKGLHNALRYSEFELALKDARILNSELPVKIMYLFQQGNNINVLEMPF